MRVIKNIKSHELFDNSILNSGLMTAKQTAGVLGVSVKTLYVWVKTYRIPSVTLGRCIRFRPEDIAEIRAGQRSLK